MHVSTCTYQSNKSHAILINCKISFSRLRQIVRFVRLRFFTCLTDPETPNSKAPHILTSVLWFWAPFRLHEILNDAGFPMIVFCKSSWNIFCNLSHWVRILFNLGGFSSDWVYFLFERWWPTLILWWRLRFGTNRSLDRWENNSFSNQSKIDFFIQVIHLDHQS